MNTAELQAHRRAHVPADATCVRPEETDLEIWCWTTKQQPGSTLAPYTAIAFAGRSAKHRWCYSFRTSEQRDAYIRAYADKIRTSTASKMARAAERRTFAHGLVCGQVLVSHWGYEQTNVTFYEVTEVHGRVVVVRKLKAERYPASDGPTQPIMPVAGQYDEHEKPKRRVPYPDSENKPAISIESYEIAHVWDGKVQTETAAAYGH